MRKKLIYLRKSMGFKPEHIAHKLNVSNRMYYYYESGKRNPTMKKANALEDIFGIPQRELLEIVDEDEHNVPIQSAV